MTLARRGAMQGVIRDLRYSVRALFRSPIVAVTAILTMGIGAGANATVASFIDALLYRPAAGVSEAARLVSVFSSDYSSGPYGGTSLPDFVSMADAVDAFEALAASDDDPGVIVTAGRVSERVGHSAVSANFFDVAGVRPALGRGFTGADTAGGSAPVAVIGHAFWTRVFDAQPSALGTSLSFAGQSYTVIGVAAEGFEGLDLSRAREIWTLLPPPSQDPAERGDRGLHVIARLRDGATLPQAQAQLDALADRLGREYPATNLGTLEHPDRPRPFALTRYTRVGPQFRSQVTMISAVLISASLLVLIIAAANVGNLLMARSSARQRELAIRLAIGASRARIVRQLLLESATLGVAGGIVGVTFALWTSDALPSFFPAEQVRLLNAAIDGRVLAFCLLTSVAASVVFGLAPAVQALRPSPVGVLRREASTLSESRAGSRTRRSLVIVQVAVALVLLVGAGLLTKSLRNSLEADLGFGTRQGAVVSVDLPPDVPGPRGLVFYRDALDRVRSLPGVENAALTTVAPLTRGGRRGFRIDGYQPREGEDMEQFINTISPAYFETMRIPLVAGRAFDERDTATSQSVVIVNEQFAARYLPGDPIGRRVRDTSGELEVIGVVRASALLDARSPRLPVVYYPLAQRYTRSVRLIASTAADPAALLPATVDAVKGLGAGVAVFRPMTIQGHLDDALAGDRLIASLVSVCGVFAMVLAAVGLYGMVAYSVTLKTREIGIRVALGASSQRVSRLVLHETLTLTASGVLTGLALAAGTSTLARSLFFEVSPIDPATYITVPLLLAAVSLCAAWIPMRRALRVDPAQVLRQL